MTSAMTSVWSEALDRAVTQIADAAPFDLAVEALLHGAAALSLEAYSFIGEAGVLLARAGRTERALALAAQELKETPAQWDAAPVYAAVVARAARDGDEAAARDVLRRAVRAAEAARIYERAGPAPALYDLLVAVASYGLAALVPRVAEAATPTGRSVVDAWRADNPAPRGGPIGLLDIAGDADATLAALAAKSAFDDALAAAGKGENAYIRIANFVAVAQEAGRRGRTEIVDRAFAQALSVQTGSFAEEARQQLIYHEEFRFKAAHGLGMAAHALLGARRFGFAARCLAHARASDELYAGGGLLVAAGEAAMP